MDINSRRLVSICRPPFNYLGISAENSSLDCMSDSIVRYHYVVQLGSLFTDDLRRSMDHRLDPSIPSLQIIKSRDSGFLREGSYRGVHIKQKYSTYTGSDPRVIPSEIVPVSVLGETTRKSRSLCNLSRFRLKAIKSSNERSIFLNNKSKIGRE